jgi:putative ABC transport system permease protein
MSSTSGWKRLFRLDESPGHLENTIDDELLFHIEGRMKQLIESGSTEAEARAEAMQEFGGVEETRSTLQRMGSRRLRRRRLAERLDDVVRDLRLAARTYWLEPGFSITALLIMTLGIGATTTIFSVVDAVILRDLPFPDPGQLVYFERAAHTVPRYRDWKASSTSFESLGAMSDAELDYTGGDVPARLRGLQVTSEILPMFGGHAQLGRLFSLEEYQGIPGVVVLGHGCWQRRFGSDESIVGQTITLSGYPAVVIGVLDESFVSPNGLTGTDVDLWLPYDAARPDLQRNDYYILEVIGRLRTGISLREARRELDRLSIQLAAEKPEIHTDGEGNPRRIPIVSLQSALTGDVQTPLILVLGAVGLLLAIACANVANLYLARGTRRTHEIALRTSLGAGRGRIIGLLLTESVLLAVIGGLLGVVVAIFGVRTFEILSPGGIPMIDRMGINPRVLMFAAGVSLFTGVLFGLAPAWQAWRMDVGAALKDMTRSATGGRRRARLRSSLVITEIALALVLLVGAGLLFNSFIRVRSVDPGFDPEGIVVTVLRLDAPHHTEEYRVGFSKQLLERVEALAGVKSAALCWSSPFQHYGGVRSGSFYGGFRTEDGRIIDAFTGMMPVTRDYFSLLGASLRGRMIGPGDTELDPVPVVVSSVLAELLCPGEEAIGRTFAVDDEDDSGRPTVLQVIGVVSGLHHWGLEQGADEHVYVSWDRFSGQMPRLSIMVNTTGDAGSVIPSIQEAIWETEPALPIREVFTLPQRIRESLVEPRFYTFLLLAFAVVAILLAAGGVYGSMLYSVGQRRRELGIRTALGADQGRLIRMVLRQGAVLALVGISIGIAAALAVARTLSGLTFGITPYDIPTFVAVVLLLSLVAVGATFVPAWRATRADPVETLRVE